MKFMSIQRVRHVQHFVRIHLTRHGVEQHQVVYVDHRTLGVQRRMLVFYGAIVVVTAKIMLNMQYFFLITLKTSKTNFWIDFF